MLKKLRISYESFSRTHIVSLLILRGIASYIDVNRTRQASARESMHTWRVFYFGAGCR